MSLHWYETTVTTTGGAGSATGSATLALEAGHLEWIYVDYNASAPGTTDVTFAHGSVPPAGNILVINNNATDGQYYPRAPTVDDSNNAITNSGDRVAIMGPLSISVAGSDALDPCITVTVCVDDQ